MIVDIHHGDITNPRNKLDIIIGMNTSLAEASAIGRRVLINKSLTRELGLGDVVTFTFDEHRNLHMLICHYLGSGGWINADKFIRLGLDHLWQCSEAETQFSIVRIGTGPVGIRDGADHAAIHTAMADSWLPLHLYIREPKQVEARVVQFPPLKALRAWSYEKGEREIRIAA